MNELDHLVIVNCDGVLFKNTNLQGTFADVPVNGDRTPLISQQADQTP
jgi:hypothetical protein